MPNPQGQLPIGNARALPCVSQNSHWRSHSQPDVLTEADGNLEKPLTKCLSSHVAALRSEQCIQAYRLVRLHPASQLQTAKRYFIISAIPSDQQGPKPLHDSGLGQTNIPLHLHARGIIHVSLLNFTYIWAWHHHN